MLLKSTLKAMEQAQWQLLLAQLIPQLLISIIVKGPQVGPITRLKERKPCNSITNAPFQTTLHPSPIARLNSLTLMLLEAIYPIGIFKNS